MTDVACLLADLSRHGVRPATDGRTLRLYGPVAALPPETLAACRAAKAEIIAALPPQGPRDTAGTLAEAIQAHCGSCRVCRPAHFTTDTVLPLCGQGRELKDRYREARREALGG